MPVRNDKTTISMKRFADIAQSHVQRPIKVIVEIGSLNGNDARYLQKRFPDAAVYAIEGLRENYNQFMKGREDGLHYINAVVADRDGQTPYHIKNVNGIHGIFDRGKKYGTRVRQEDCYTMSSLREVYEIPNIDMMKIDVEGATLEVLEGMEADLEKVSIMHLETESVQYFQGQRLHPEVAGWLQERGWKLLEKKALRIMDGVQYDTVWINPARANDLTPDAIAETELESSHDDDEGLQEDSNSWGYSTPSEDIEVDSESDMFGYDEEEGVEEVDDDSMDEDSIEEEMRNEY